VKKTNGLKLQLNRETLLKLVLTEDLVRVQGGTSYLCTDTCHTRCLNEPLTRMCA
jgi:hypothetical protein